VTVVRARGSQMRLKQHYNILADLALKVVRARGSQMRLKLRFCRHGIGMASSGKGAGFSDEIETPTGWWECEMVGRW